MPKVKHTNTELRDTRRGGLDKGQRETRQYIQKTKTEMEAGQLTKSDEKQNSTQDREQLNYKREEERENMVN